VFLRLSRTANAFAGAWSSDGVSWHDVGSATVSLPSEALAGLALTSHSTPSTATAVFADPSIRF